MELRDNGTLVHDGIAIGRITEDEGITINLGWCAHAGVDVIVQGNPDVEGRRVVFDRKAGAVPGSRKAEDTDQPQLSAAEGPKDMAASDAVA